MRQAAQANAIGRLVLGRAMRSLGALVTGRTEASLAGYDATQAGLRGRYGIAADTPIRGYDEELRARMRAVPGAVMARTSGSTEAPKEIAYTRARLRAIKRAFALTTLRTVHATGSTRPFVFTLASLADDDSFTALMTRSTASRLDCLVTPHTVLADPALRPYLETHGTHALRVWAMVLSRPGWLYSTNPSTQAAFFHALATDWARHTAFLRDFRSGRLDASVTRVASRIVVPGWEERAARLLDASTPLHPSQWLDVEVTVSWDGGNNAPYVRQVREWLPHATFVPMFSMSTETIETLTVYAGDTPRFLPIAPGVLYEFLPEDATDDAPALLLGPRQLEAGEHYLLVASDSHGLTRYMTEDVFLCRGHHRGLPDLHFRRRRGLTWSFTGEKLTGAQVQAAWESVASEHTSLAGVQATVMPSEPPGARLPGYRLVLTAPGGVIPEGTPATDAIGRAWDDAAGRINEEYRHKRESDRLAPPVADWVDYDALARALRGDRGEEAGRGWDSQFKLLPLTCRRFESLELPRTPD